MKSCKIQKPNVSQSRHGKLYAQISCDGVAGDECKFDSTKGDLRLHLICEAAESSNFYIGSVEEALEPIKQKIEMIIKELEILKNKK